MFKIILFFWQPSSGYGHGEGVPAETNVRQLAMGRFGNVGSSPADVHRPQLPHPVQY